MLFTNIFNDGFGLLSRQLKFYCWHYKKDLDNKHKQELRDLLREQHFERLANKIKSLEHNGLADCKQQVGKLLMNQCLAEHRRHQLIQLIESNLIDIDVRLDNYGRTLLHRTAYSLDVGLVKILLDNRVNIRLRDYAGNTALHIAIQSYRNGALIFSNEPDVVKNLTSIIKLLLDADKNLRRERYSRKRVRVRALEDIDEQRVMSSQEKESKDDGLSEQDNNLSSFPKRSPLVRKTYEFDSSGTRLCKQLIPTSNSDRFDLPEKRPYYENLFRGYVRPIMLEDTSNPLIDTRNAFGRTALHYCVLVVGEQHLEHFVKLLVSYDADTDAIDTRMRTPLYCLVKRPGVGAIRQKCRAISHLLSKGCDDLGLAIEPDSFFNESFICNLQKNLPTTLSRTESQEEPIFTTRSFSRVPTLKHLARLNMIRLNDKRTGRTQRQTGLIVPTGAPRTLNAYLNRKILDQIEFYN